jgi:ABC-type uncharacterized transport system ATPase subunit
VQIINEGSLVYASDTRTLQEQQNTSRYEIALSHPPSIDDLLAEDCIDQVEPLSTNRFIVLINSSAEELATAVVNNDWGLHKLAAQEHSLEQIFVNLTLGEGVNT